MKNPRIYRLLALVLVLMLAMPCLGMAEEDYPADPAAQDALTEAVEGAPVEGTEGIAEATEELTEGTEGIAEGTEEIAEDTEAPVEVPEEEIVAEEQETTPAVCEAELDLEAIEEVPAEASGEIASEDVITEDVVPGETVAEETIAEAPTEEVPPVAETASEEAADAASDAVVEAPAEAITETVAEAALTEAFLNAASLTEAAVTEAAVTEAAPAEAAPAGEAAVLNEVGAAQSYEAGTGGAPTAVAINASQGNVFYLGMGPSQLSVVMDPADARTTLKWKSSKKKVVRVDANGVVTPRKAGKAKITVTTGNKKKSSISVTVLKNIVDGINARPSRAMVRSIGRNWTIAPKSLERTAGGKYVCKFYLLNGLGKSKRINNLGMQLYVGGTLVAQKHLKRLKVSCGKGSTKVFKVTFGGADIVNPTPLLLPQYGASGILIRLTTNPSLTYTYRK